jgi:hypothetical protein
MKNIAFFITHKTLSYEHAEATIRSLGFQEIRDEAKLDVLYVYNTHQDELSNASIEALLEKHNVQRVCKEIKVFNYDPATPKALAADIAAVMGYAQEVYDSSDRVLLLKSDCVLSKNFLDDILHLPAGDMYFVAPFICAKARVSDEEIFEYAQRDQVVFSDDITFFVEDQTNSTDNDFSNRPGVDVTDEDIRFTCCYVISDFSCHLITASLASRLNLQIQSWGGAKFHALTEYHHGTNRSFVIHKFHDIISENRSTDREGPVKDWLAS